jgi:tRNA nucleotidyltransferase/poly(A) polymerase
MLVQLPAEVVKIIRVFEKNGFEIYIVGGAVRDMLMEKPVYDWDFTTNATPQKMLKLLQKMDAYYSNEFGTVGIPNASEGERPFEITTYRTEHGYSDLRRPDNVSWGKSLEEDLKRRDFTINSMALALGKTEAQKNKGTKEKKLSMHYVLCSMNLIDLYDGQKDLDKKLVRAVGDANERFGEDALRMMRAVRIAAELGFTIEQKTLDAIKTNATLINKIAKERVKDELFKILASAFPYEGIMILKNVGLMEQILPEMEKTFGVEQKSPGRHHIHDVGTHSMLSLKYVSQKNKDPLVRLATMIHDIGKPQTFKILPNGVITFYNHEVVSTKMASSIADRLRFSNKEKQKLLTLVRWHQFSVDERQTDSAIRRFIRKVGKENIADMLDLRVGDRLGGGARETSWRLEEFKKRLIEVQKQPFSLKDLKISGNDVMEILKLKPGPKVGEVLNKTFEMVENKELENKKPQLIKFIKTLS